METNHLLSEELPFASLTNDSLQNVLSDNSQSIVSNYEDLEFHPFSVDNEKYNFDLEVNEFLLRNRLSNTPHTHYALLNDLTLESNRTVTIFNLNIRSIPKNFQILQDTVLHNFENNFDVMGFTEIRLDPHMCSLYELPGYYMYTNSRNVHGGGVALYVSTDYNTSVLNQLEFSNPSIETLGVVTTIVDKKYLFLCIYRPPNGNFNDFLNVMTDVLSSVADLNFHGLYIFGDFNLNLLSCHDNNVFEFINLMYSFSLYPVITRPTRVTRTSATLIDHIWTSQPEENIGNYVIQTDISDHFPTVSQFRFDSSPHRSHYISKRFYTKKSLEKFTNDLTLVNWNFIFNSTCAEEAYNLFYSKFREIFEINFPLKSICQNRKTADSPYITPALKNSIKEKHRLERLSKKWPLTYRDQYKRFRNTLTSTLRTAKSLYYKNKITANQGNPKSQWSTINFLLGRSKSLSRTIELQPPCNDTADKFNDHFLNNAHASNEETNYKDYLKNSPNFSFFLAPTDKYEVDKILNSLKSYTPGYDDISPKVLKYTSHLISVPLAHIINLSFNTGIFPSQLKTAKVIPIFKSGDRRDINNYRPISILPAFNKIFEKIISFRLTNYLEANNLLTDCQHGFRANRSTESALLQFVNDVYLALEEKKYAIGVFIDLSKAFDTLDHRILLHKLAFLGIRGVPLKLFESYLTCRKQAVYCNNCYSHLKSIDKGVPQGSVLGPILFLVYINDIVNTSEIFKFVIYADDTTLFLKDKNLDSLHSKLNLELNNVKSWVHANKLIINVSKTSFIFFQNRSVNNPINPVSLDGQVIRQVTHTKFLGITIDQNLNFKQHIDQTCLKVSKITGILYRIRHNLTTEAMISIYYTLCHPHLMYCVSVWACTWPSFLSRLSVAQNKILRCIFFLKKFDSTSYIYSEFKLMKFTSIHKYFMLLLIYKSLKQNMIFRLIDNTVNTRNNNINLVCPVFRTTLFKVSIINLGPTFFNGLPLDIKVLLTSESFEVFKKNIKAYMISQHNL